MVKQAEEKFEQEVGVPVDELLPVEDMNYLVGGRRTCPYEELFPEEKSLLELALKSLPRPYLGKKFEKAIEETAKSLAGIMKATFDYPFEGMFPRPGTIGIRLARNEDLTSRGTACLVWGFWSRCLEFEKLPNEVRIELGTMKYPPTDLVWARCYLWTGDMVVVAKLPRTLLVKFPKMTCKLTFDSHVEVYPAGYALWVNRGGEET